ncbi:hypothetical protein HDU89_005716 [Geranomyces variabilis]|nr:hypothetical protein HDU89_005716 [Geranomyces variabilis]
MGGRAQRIYRQKTPGGAHDESDSDAEKTEEQQVHVHQHVRRPRPVGSSKHRPPAGKPAFDDTAAAYFSSLATATNCDQGVSPDLQLDNAAAEQHAVAAGVRGAQVPLFVKKTEERGRGIHADKAIPAGRAVLSEVPYAAVVDDLHLSSHCSACFGTNARFRCGKCGVLQYCSQTCQRQDWAMHKAECPAFRKVAPRKPPTAIRVLCRILWQRALDPPSYHAVEKLQSHRSEQTAERLETFAQMTMLIRSLVGEDVCLGAEAMVKLLCQFSCNSISISDEELVNIGVGMFPTLALVNHSCSPNTAIIFNGSKGTLRTIKPVVAGEEVFQSYTEIAEPRHVRQCELQQTYFFTCACPVCSVGQRADPRTTYLCPRRSQLCAGIVGLTEHVHSAVCSVHGSLTADEQSQLEALVTEAHAQYNEAIKARDAGKDMHRALELALRSRALLGPITRAGNAARLRTDRLLLALYLQEGDFAGAYSIACEMKEAFDVLYEGQHPAKAVQAYLVYKLAEWAEPDNRALLLQLGEAAVATVRGSHGEASAMWKEAMEKLRPLKVGVPGAFA